MTYTITRDGRPVGTVERIGDVLDWFHRNVPYLMHHATAYEGYAVADHNGSPLLWPVVNGRQTLYYRSDVQL